MSDKNMEQVGDDYIAQANQNEQDATSVCVRLDDLTIDELTAVLYLSYAFLTGQTDEAIARPKAAITALLGEMTIGEWTVMGQVLYARYKNEITKIANNRAKKKTTLIRPSQN